LSDTPNILSLGAGVQSTTLYIMAALGDITPRPEFAIFADTQNEPAHVYSHLDTLENTFGSLIPIHRVTKGNLRNEILSNITDQKNHFASIPLHIANGDGSTSILRRQCTKEYKIEPINKETWRVYKRRPIIQWIGISLDEAIRMKPSRTKRTTNRYPLIELRMTRWDCILWLQRHNQTIPQKSACIFCPYHSNDVWRTMKTKDPVSWKEAITFDQQIRQIPGMRDQTFLHRSGLPLPDVDLRSQQENGQLQLFDLECEGMCGV
jgi:hypothetical protein